MWSILGPVPSDEVPALSLVQSKLSPPMLLQPHKSASSNEHSAIKTKQTKKIYKINLFSNMVTLIYLRFENNV